MTPASTPLTAFPAGTRVFFSTQGCRVNQYETEVLRAWAAGLGWEEVDAAAAADLAIINSCAVTEAAMRDLRRMVRALREARPEIRIVVTGCAPEADPRLRDCLAVEVLPQAAKRQFLALARTQIPRRPRHRTRAVVGIQDGCNTRCTYCIIPITRGPAQSRAPEEILAEVDALCRQGVPEITLSAISTRWYACGATDFWDLVAMVDRMVATRYAGRTRLRLGSLDPVQLDAKAAATLAQCQAVCPHLHLSLQSASPSVLARMGRSHYHPDAILRFVDSLAAVWPVFGLGVDVIAGFPGETEAEWQATLDFARQLPLTYAHVFPYSERPGTVAAGLPGAIPRPERQRRARALRECVRQIQARVWTAMHGRTVQVVLETATQGRAETYAPCRLTRPMPPGGIVCATVITSSADHLVVRPTVENPS